MPPNKQIGDGSESHPYRDIVGRRSLPHDPPLYIDPNRETFFITICCKKRGGNQLCYRETASALIDAVRYYEQRPDWFVHIMVLMPDHMHCLASFSTNTKLRSLIARWKRYTATRAKIQWQRDFFDHRLRGDEAWREKADYILANPVRAGLVESLKIGLTSCFQSRTHTVGTHLRGVPNSD